MKEYYFIIVTFTVCQGKQFISYYCGSFVRNCKNTVTAFLEKNYRK